LYREGFDFSECEFIPSGRSISPFTGRNWEGQGVQPDYETTAEEALPLAQQKAMEKIKEKYESQPVSYLKIEEAKLQGGSL